MEQKIMDILLVISQDVKDLKKGQVKLEANQAKLEERQNKLESVCQISNSNITRILEVQIEIKQQIMKKIERNERKNEIEHLEFRNQIEIMEKKQKLMLY